MDIGKPRSRSAFAKDWVVVVDVAGTSRSSRPEDNEFKETSALSNILLKTVDAYPTGFLTLNASSASNVSMMRIAFPV